VYIHFLADPVYKICFSGTGRYFVIEYIHFLNEYVEASSITMSEIYVHVAVGYRINQMYRAQKTIEAGHEAPLGIVEVYTVFWWGNLRAGDHLEYPGVDGRIILRLIFRK